jgi:hypothetical protein
MEIGVPVEIIGAALRSGEHRALRGWILLQFADTGRTGRLRRADAVAFLKRRGFPKSTIQDILQEVVSSGMAAVRRSKSGTDFVVLLGRRAMLDRFDVPRSRWTIPVSIARLKRGKGIRSYLFTLVQAAHGNMPIARVTLQEMTGVSKSSQIRAEKHEGVRVGREFARYQLDRLERIPWAAEGHEGHRSFNRNGSHYRQIPNTYWHPRATRKKQIIYGTHGHCRTNTGRQPTFKRRFFLDSQQAMKHGVWHGVVGGSRETRPALIVEEPEIVGGLPVGVWGVV